MSQTTPQETLPVPGEGFVWVVDPWGPALVCQPLAAIAAHRFSTRAWSLPPGDRPTGGWHGLAEVLGVGPDQIVLVRQVHGATAVVLRRSDATSPLTPVPAADVIASDDPQRALAVRVADCVPLLLADPRIGAVAAAHVGWRGLAAGAPGAAARTLADAFGARPGDLVAALGPTIGPCCYEVGPELPEHFRAAGHSATGIARWFRGAGGRLRLDLPRAVRDLLEAAGVQARRIMTADLCTATHLALFHSYRREGRAAGRVAGIIRAPGDR